VVVKASVRVNAYAVIQDAVETACADAARRIFKHTDGVINEEQIPVISEIFERYVMLALCELLSFGDE